MALKKLHLEIITQEKRILNDEVDLILAPGYDGQIGILPGHIGLLTKLQAGELYIFKGPSMNMLAVSGGLLDVHDDQVSVMADSAVRAEEIDIAQVEAAKRKAEEALREKLSHEQFVLAESDLRKAVLELKVAQKRHHYRAPVQE
ncbi:MAG: ATP synthase F1 subunit epsilon [Candidatus Beckwithbacteria bacterium]|nr:ATP synthase F1 subunit epsilon [Candidatus Beckwithbacteria bacterium]